MSSNGVRSGFGRCDVVRLAHGTLPSDAVKQPDTEWPTSLGRDPMLLIRTGRATWRPAGAAR